MTNNYRNISRLFWFMGIIVLLLPDNFVGFISCWRLWPHKFLRLIIWWPRNFIGSTVRIPWWLRRSYRNWFFDDVILRSVIIILELGSGPSWCWNTMINFWREKSICGLYFSCTWKICTKSTFQVFSASGMYYVLVLCIFLNGWSTMS